MRALLLSLVLLGSLLVLAPHASACATPAGGGDCDPGPVGVCLGAAIGSTCRADLVCVTQFVEAKVPDKVCVENAPT